MLTLPALVYDLTLILVAAGVTTVIFRRLRQPVVLGYILAGFFLSPEFPWTMKIIDGAGIQAWADIGVVFLLFALGLEFSLKRLAKVGGPAFITTVIKMAVMIAAGYLTGRLLSWSPMDSLFLGGILAISSTTIIVRAFEETGVKGRGFVHLAMAVLIVEDLFAIILLVLLSTVAASRGLSGVALAYSVSKLIFFLTIWFVGGVFLVPSLLNKLRSLLNDETLLVVSLGLCFVMVNFALKAGFSPALGAFLMGSILAETPEAEKIEALIRPIKDLFAAVFFVSIGMLINPYLLKSLLIPILVVSAVTLVVKILSTILGALIARQSLRHSIQSGLSLAQIGEFSYVIASLGLTMHVTSEFLYPIAVGVSAITTFATPYLIGSADSLHRLVERRVPLKMQRLLEQRRTSHQEYDVTLNLRRQLLKIFANSVICVGIFLGIDVYVSPMLIARFADARLTSAIGLLLSLIISGPFFWAIVMSRTQLEESHSLRLRGSLQVLHLFRWIIAVFLFGLLSTRFILPQTALAISIALLIMLLVGFSSYLRSTYSWMEEKFLQNLHQKSANSLPPLAPWDAHLTRFTLSPDSLFVGKSLEQLAIREHYGVTIALIERGRRKIPAPSREDVLFPFDRLSVIGTDEHIQRFRVITEAAGPSNIVVKSDSYRLQAIRINETSPFCFISIRDSGIRELCHGLVVGVERKGRRILNPDSLLKIEPNDLLWIVGDQDLLRSL